MKLYNVIIVYNKTEDKILMCLRSKEPYKGLYNLVGGKIEAGEDELSSAYRELLEETGITKNDINLTHLMDFTYPLRPSAVKVYVGKLNNNVSIKEEVNKLYWIEVNSNFFDTNTYAGEGNIGHMIEQVKIYYNQIFN